MRVLIVEDDHKIAGSIKRGLEQETMAVDVTIQLFFWTDRIAQGKCDSSLPFCRQ